MAKIEQKIDQGGVQVIARAASVLRALAEDVRGLSLADIAGMVDLPRSTVQRIVNALSEEGFVVTSTNRRSIRLGPAISNLAAAVIPNVCDLAAPMLKEAAKKAGETVDLSVLRGDAAVFVDHALSSQRMAAISSIGSAMPLHCSANGKAILATMSSTQRKRLLSKPLGKFTATTITDIKSLELEIERVVDQGYAFDNAEHSDAVSAVGAAFIDPYGRHVAVSIPAPNERFAAKEKMLIELVVSTRDAIQTIIEESADQ